MSFLAIIWSLNLIGTARTLLDKSLLTTGSSSFPLIRTLFKLKQISFIFADLSKVAQAFLAHFLAGSWSGRDTHNLLNPKSKDFKKLKVYLWKFKWGQEKGLSWFHFLFFRNLPGYLLQTASSSENVMLAGRFLRNIDEVLCSSFEFSFSLKSSSKTFRSSSVPSSILMTMVLNIFSNSFSECISKWEVFNNSGFSNKSW